MKLVLTTLVVLAVAISDVLSVVCDPTKCQVTDNCRCSSVGNPIDPPTDAPQLVAITVSESIVESLYTDYLIPLFNERKNADGGAIGVTYYVNHEYTDYTLVNNLFKAGNEIGVHSITKNPLKTYWETATKEDLVEEFGGQKTILNHFGNIPEEKITGARTPQLNLEGDVSIQAYVESKISYDNSWPTLSDYPMWPYTLNYDSSQQCNVAMSCPKEEHAGFWVVPITNIKGNDSVECNSFVTCDVNSTRAEVTNWLLSEYNRVKDSVRVPIVLRLDSYWFDYYPNSFEAFGDFLDTITQDKETFLVTVQDVIEWVKNPVKVGDYSSPDHSDQATVRCRKYNCNLQNEDNVTRYMGSCVPCPTVYPWKGNPLGEEK